MAFFEFKNVKLTGIASCVPKAVVSSEESIKSGNYNATDFIKATGIKNRHLDESFTTSDLCFQAAEKLISDLHWDKSEIGVLIFVTQGPDFIAPSTACIMQDRLGLSKECYAAELPLGCSGWVYGLSYVASLLCGGSVKKGLLLVGDARLQVPTEDPLVGFAGTATALEYIEGVLDGLQFHFGTDGSGYEAIYIPDGGARNQISLRSFEMENINGKMLNRLQPRMNGMDVFSFAISTAPKSIKKALEHFARNLDEFDYCVLHQANIQIDEIIRNKLKLPVEKVPYSLREFGNTSSASIPITISTQLKGKIEGSNVNLICCGFGIGLSWGTVLLSLDNIVLSDLIKC